MHAIPVAPPRRPFTLALRWTARVASLASIALLAAFAAEPGVPTLTESIALVLFPGGVVLGMILAWWKELAGGMLGVSSLAAFYLYMLLMSGRVPGGPYFLIFASPVFLFLLAGLITRAGSDHVAKDSPSAPVPPAPPQI